MTKTQQIDQLDRAIRDSDIRLYSVKSNIDNISKEVEGLSIRKNELEQNLDFLKQEDTIPLAQVYKKVKSELAKINSRLNIITSDRAKAQNAATEIEYIIAKLKRDHAALIISSENNILKGNFGGRRGKT